MALGILNALFGYIRCKLTTQEKIEVKQYPPSDIHEFHDFKKLKDHLINCPDLRDKVIVEGRVEEHEYSLASTKPYAIGAAQLKETITWEYGQSSKKTEINNFESVPFKLVDTNGNHIHTDSIHTAEGFKLILDTIFKSEPEKQETQVVMTTHSMLKFGTPIGAFGYAVLKDNSNSSDVSFYPFQVGISAKSLIDNTPDTGSASWNWKTLLIVLGLGVGVSALVFAGFYYLYIRRPEKPRNGGYNNPLIVGLFST